MEVAYDFNFNIGTSIEVQWIEPYDGGKTITSYTVEFKKSDGTYQVENSYCLGTDPIVISSLSCTVPTTILTASPYSLTVGSSVVARITATNQIGSSPSGLDSSGQAVIQGIPNAPLTGPTRGSETTASQIQIDINTLTGSDAGYATITSYGVEWDQGQNSGSFYEIAGETSDSLQTSYIITSSITMSQSYIFRYHAKNVFGFGSYSPTSTIKAIDVPDQPTNVSIQNNGANVIITWTAPNDNGSPITSYDIECKTTAGSYVGITCTETDAVVISSTTCTNPMNTFTQTPFSLTEGQSILIKLRALNELDYGPYGSPSSTLAVIIDVPHTPASGPVRVNDSTSPTQVTVTIPEIPNDLDGGSSILSYSLEWNQGSGTTFIDLIGLSSDSLVLEFTQSVAGAAGSIYTFRYRARNVIGWSNYSPTTDIVAASAPTSPLNVVVSLVGTNIIVSWSLPSSTNGDSVIAYKVLILTSTSGVYAEDTSSCASNPSVVLNLRCTIPMSDLWIAPFLLIRGSTTVKPFV